MPETPAVVLTSKGVSLADKLRLSELPLATTSGGKTFCLKALHPSEHTIKTARVPGGNLNSVALCCDMIQTIPIATANTAARIALNPNPLIPASVYIADSNGQVEVGMFYNTALGGFYQKNPTVADTNTMMTGISGKIQNYRITSESATVELIAPALSDQGTITAFQFVSKPLTMNPSDYDGQGGHLKWMPDALLWSEPPAASYALSGTNAYTSKAREGVYMPLKLNSFKWRNWQDPAQYYQISGQVYGSLDQIPVPDQLASTLGMNWPFCEARATATCFTVPRVPKMCGDNFGMIYVEGIAKDVAIRIRVRQVLEITCLPGTTYAPLVEPALPPDPTALKMYSEISARLKDGYPSSYNDLGTLFSKIMDIGKKVLPYVEPALSVLQSVPGPVGGIATAAKQAIPVVETVVKTVKAAKKKKKAKAQATAVVSASKK